MSRSDGEVVHTHFGKHHKYDIVRKPTGVFSNHSYDFYVLRDGERHRGPYSRLDEAVEAAEEER